MAAAARYRITHGTHYQYSDSVAICQNQVMMIPRRLPRVCCHDTRVEITPQPGQSSWHVDYFGNPVHTFAIESAHRRLDVTVTSDVEVAAPQLPLPEQTSAWDRIRDDIEGGRDEHWWSVWEFRLESRMVAGESGFTDYALQSFPTGRPILEASLELTRRIHADFKYDSSATNVDTTAIDAFKLGAGVCQDFAHIQIGCLRAIGLPVRYVSGYLRTIPPPGKPRLVGADQSHAWVSLYAGSELGWVDFDPTNACLAACDHVPICIGRDYRDVTPMRGVVLGGGVPELKVSVDVVPVSEGDVVPVSEGTG